MSENSSNQSNQRKQHIRSFNKKTPSQSESARPRNNQRGSRPPNQRRNNNSRRGGHPAQNRNSGQRRHQNPPTPPAPKTNIPAPAKDVIRVIPLGGVEQIGKNMTMIELNDSIVVVDAGFAFTDENTPGIDYILPNTSYLEENKHKIKAVVITHGHLDHIGGLPFLMERIGNPPLYTREFGSLLIQKRQEEFPDKPALDIKTVTEKEGSIRLDENFAVRFFGLTHSIPDSTGVIVETPFGDIVNTGDVRVDNINGVPTDVEREQWEFFKDRNILMLTMDSTNIDRPGWSLSESVVATTVDKIIKDATGRVMIATFASQVERIIAFLESAKRYGKKVVVEGRSMKTNVGIVEQLQLTDTSHVIPISEMSNHPDHKIMILATGAQGEEFAALMRIANRTHKDISLKETDTIVLSSSVIPGNDKAVQNLKDHLYRHDARIITYLDSDVHASGHGKRDELKWIHEQIPYRFFMPVHGHHYMLKLHREMVVNELGVDKQHVVVPDNGSIIEISDSGNKISVLEEKVPSDDMYVEGGEVDAFPSDIVLRDRKALAEDGIIVIISLVNTRNGKLRKSPDIASRGFVYLRDSQELLHDVRNITRKIIEKSNKNGHVDFDTARKEISRNVGKLLFQKTKKRPIVVALIIGV